MALYEALKESMDRQPQGESHLLHAGHVLAWKRDGINKHVKGTTKSTSSPGGISHSSEDSGYHEQDERRMESMVTGVLGGEDLPEEGDYSYALYSSRPHVIAWPPSPFQRFLGSESGEVVDGLRYRCCTVDEVDNNSDGNFFSLHTLPPTGWIVPEGSYSRLSGPYIPEASSEVMAFTQMSIREIDKQLENTNAKLAALSEATGMPIAQENGQRRYGPPVGETFIPPKGTEVFVGKLPRDCIETEIVPVFEKVGKIYEIRLMMDFSGTNRGYCFVQYFTTAEASRAVQELNQYEIRKGRMIGVAKSVDNCRLFVGGIPKDKSQSEIYDEINKVTEGVVRVIAYPSIKDRSENRGFAFVEYESHKAAAMARRKMIPGAIQMWRTDVAVDWAEPEPDVDEEIMKKVKALYVRNLLLNTTEDTLRNVFNEASNNAVERVRKLKDFGFVHFVDRASAEIALERLNNTEIDGSPVSVMWSKPVDKRTHNAHKALARTLYPPVGGSGGGVRHQFMHINQPINFNNNYFNSNMYSGSSRIVQNQYQGITMGAENVELQFGGNMFPAQQQYGGNSVGLEQLGYQAYQQQYGENLGMQNQVALLPNPPQPQQHASSFDPSFVEQFQRMNFGNEYHPTRGRSAGGIQGMRLPYYNRQLPTTGFNFNTFFHFPQNHMTNMSPNNGPY